MSSEKLIEYIKQFANKGHITESEMKILRLKAKSFDISDRTLDILVNQEIVSNSKNDKETSIVNKDENDVKSAKTTSSSSNNAVIYGIIGFLLGIPLSYFFQAEKIRAVYSLPQYLIKLPEILSSKNTELFVPVILTCIISTVIFALIGNAIRKKK